MLSLVHEFSLVYEIVMNINLKPFFTIANTFFVYILQPQEEMKMSLEDAIRLIQIHERARQGRLRAKYMGENHMQEKRLAEARQRGNPTLDPDIAATRVQKVRNQDYS